MTVSKQPLAALVGATAFLLSSSLQAAVMTAAAAFDLSSIVVSNATAVAPFSYEASVETPFSQSSRLGSSPVSALVDSSFQNGSASATADLGELDASALTILSDAYDAGYASAAAAYNFTYEAVDIGAVSISIDYSAFYDLDNSSIANALISLIILDSLGGYDEVFLMPGGDTVDVGTLTSTGLASAAGEVGTITLLASAGVDSGVEAIPVPTTLLMLALGLVAMRQARKQSFPSSSKRRRYALGVLHAH